MPCATADWLSCSRSSRRRRQPRPSSCLFHNVSPSASQVSPDLVIARLMSFDRNQDGKISTDELSERMRTVVARGDSSGDGALDAAEIRAVAVVAAGTKGRVRWQLQLRRPWGVPMRTRIANAIEDLRLPAGVSEQASRIGETYAGRGRGRGPRQAARGRRPDVDRSAAGGIRGEHEGTWRQRLVVTMIPRQTAKTGALFSKRSLSPWFRRCNSGGTSCRAEQRSAAMAAMTAFNADRQLDDARRSDLMTRFEGVLSQAERDDLQAALARRPLVKNTPRQECRGRLPVGWIVRSVQ